MTTLKEKQLFESFQDKDYRDIFVEEHISVGLAHQIRELRDKYGWTQEELGDRAGKKQPVIAQLENPDYGSYTLRTLKTLASAFDVALQVNFVSFRDLIQRATNLAPDIIAPKGYEEERQISFAHLRGDSTTWPESNEESLRRVTAGQVTYAIHASIAEIERVITEIRGGLEEAGESEDTYEIQPLQGQQYQEGAIPIAAD